jgi:hypothetical protein
MAANRMEVEVMPRKTKEGRKTVNRTKETKTSSEMDG